jgi:RNA polymerase sigma factor (sigma-70 family)
MKLELEQRNALIARYMPLAQKVASNKKKTLSTVDTDELLSAAYMGLVDAASRYEPEQGGFFHFALTRIKGEVKDYLRSLGFGSKGSNSRGCQQFGSIDATDASTGCSIADSLAAKNDGELRLVFEEITEILPPQGKEVMWDYLVEGKRMKEIGKGLGLNESRVSQLISQYRKQIVVAA